MDQKAAKITVETTIDAPIEKAWKLWSEPDHIKHWAFASSDWHAPKVENDLRIGGKFLTTMAAKDGSFGFDFTGTYTEVKEHETIAYAMDDGRKVSIAFSARDGKTQVVESFDPESEHPEEMQRGGWQSILDNFKKYAESHQE